AELTANLALVGYSHDAEVDFLRGDSSTLGYRQQLVSGRWFDGAGEGVVTSTFLHQRGVDVGDRVTVELNGSRAEVRIVGQVMGGANAAILTDWGTYERLHATKAPGPIQYQVGLDSGTSVDEYRAAVHKAAADLRVEPNVDDSVASAVAALIGLITGLALMLSVVAALGVFHTVVLNIAERRRDLGMLKSVGMTPRQVVSMVVTSMVALGVVGGAAGLGLGVLAHRLVLPLASARAQIDFPDSLARIWDAPTLSLLAATGIVVAVCGAFFPARRAARLRIAEVLRNE
ncbi:MAG TPA: FtsX-like permease family protein, partial [Stackebrandtia sp.]|uniref:ABC transporter permease n=1 Tax=Stackebrandtia sp. TaxID=2023065 RepID=UPI002D4D4BF9